MEELKEKCDSAEIRTLRAIFGIDTVNGCYDIAVERGKKIEEDENFEFPCSGKTVTKSLRIVYDYMIREIENADMRIQSREDRIKRLEDLNAPEIILENEKRMLISLHGQIAGYRKLATLVYQLSSPAFVGAEPLVISETLDILTSRTPCFDCRYYQHKIKEDDEDSCLLGFDTMYCSCVGKFALDDNHTPFWEMKRNVMKELGKSDINDEEVIEESARRFNRMRRETFLKEQEEEKEDENGSDHSSEL